MRGILKIVSKDLFEFLSDPKSILLVLIIPLAFVALIGRLRGQPVSLRLLVAGFPERLQSSFNLLEDLTSVRATWRPDALSDPLQEMQKGSYDLVANVQNFDSGNWEFYTGETDPVRLKVIVVFAQRLQTVLTALRPTTPSAPCPSAPSSGAAQGSGKTPKSRAEGSSAEAASLQPPSSPALAPFATTGKENGGAGNKEEMDLLVRSFGDLPPSRFLSYYPRAQYPPALVPEVTALIVCFLPFVIAGSAVVREAQEHTLEVLLTVPELGPLELFLGKALHAVALTTFVLLAVLAEEQWLYGIGVKSNLSVALACLLPAMLSATSAGLAISAVSSSHTQALIASGGYLVGMGIFSGFLYPVALAAGSLGAWTARIFPLTFASPMLKSWMSGAGLGRDVASSLIWLALQCVVYGFLGIFLCQKLIKRI